jgi:hypothetical protein
MGRKDKDRQLTIAERRSRFFPGFWFLEINFLKYEFVISATLNQETSSRFLRDK